VTEGTRASEPCILLTNDDGYDAPGLTALVETLEGLGRLVVVAPDKEMSGAGHALTITRPLRVWETGPDRYRVDGTPTDCVHLGVFNLTGGRPPQLVVSGINRGLNVGDDVTYSGTVAGALEGTLLHIPSLALSVATDDNGRADYTVSAGLARRLAGEVLDRGLPAGTLLNVNFPAERPRGIRVTRQGTRHYRAAAVERLDPSGRPYFWIASSDSTPAGEPDGDHAAIAAGYVSITPLHSNLTDEPAMAVVSGWGLSLA
jgi:5'-nucleotidase